MAVLDNDVTYDELLDLKAKGVVGVAFNPAMEGVGVMHDAEPLLHRLAELGMFAQVQVTGDQLRDLDWVTRKTRVRMIVDHCGRPTVTGGISQAGFQALLRLADEGRTIVKLSGLQKISEQAYPYRDAQVYLHALLDAFGADHCVWGSDWPFLRATARLDYAPLLSLFQMLVPDADTRRRVLWDTPCRLFGFGVDIG
jgi:predicted TIM-barrel fold metal-dependent hydrolase